MAFGFGNLAGLPVNSLRRSVIDSDTGNALLSADALAAAPDPNEVVQRSWLLPFGVTRAGDVVPASQAPVHALGEMAKSLPDSVASGATFAHDWLNGKVDPGSEEAAGRALDMAGLAMTGGLGGAAIREGETALGAGPIRAYHGSPHDFDRFSLSAIGTGEGAQAYGHGLYFAGDENVARGYRDALSPYGGGASTKDSAARWLQRYDGDANAARAELRDQMNRAYGQGDMSAVDGLRAINGQLYSPPHSLIGRMYEVGIDADPKRLLDWDAPIAGQDASVQRFSKRAGLPAETMQYLPEDASAGRYRGGYGMAPATGSDLVQTLTSRGYDPAELSADLNKAGVPGIRYLDGNSRGAGQGLHNYVTFSDDIVNILRKYGGVGAAGAAGAASMLSQPGDAQAAEAHSNPKGPAVSAGLAPGAPSMLDGLSPEMIARLLQAAQAQQAPSGPSPADGLLFDRAGMGAPDNSFSGSSGTVVPPTAPQQAPVDSPLAQALGGAPSMLGAPAPTMPPQAPPAPQATGSLPTPPAQDDGEETPASPNAPAARAVPTPPARPSDLSALGGMQPVNSFDPLTGQPVSGSPKPIAPSAAAPAPDNSPGFLSRLSDPRVYNTLLGVGSGILSGKNFSEGLGQGVQNAAALNAAQGKQDLAQAKAQRELAGQNQTARIIARRMNVPLDDATALAMNPQFVQSFFNSQYGAQDGRVRNADGTMSVIPGSDKDPTQIAADATARREPVAEAAERAGAVTKAQQDNTPADPDIMSPGQVMLDPETHQQIAAVPAKADPTTLQKDYEYAQQHDGYKGSFQEFATDRGNQTRAQTTFNNTVNPILAAAGDRFGESLKSATAAGDTVRSIQNARAQLDAPGGIFTGTGAEQQLALQKIGAAFGVADPRTIQNTETFRTQIKPIVLETVKGLGAGSGISNADRDFALQAVGGDIKLDEGSIRRVLDITERANREKIERHNAMANGLINGENGAVYKPVASSLLVQQPDVVSRNPSPGPGAGSESAPQPEQAAPQGIMQFRTQAEYAAAPRGTRYIAPDGKLRVKQ